MDSTELLDIEHPDINEPITKENLQTLDLDTLIALLEENVDTLKRVVDGKIE